MLPLLVVDQFNDSYLPLHKKEFIPKPLTLLDEETTFPFQICLKCEQVNQDITHTAQQVKMVQEKRD